MTKILIVDNAYEPRKRKMTSKLILLLMGLFSEVHVVQTPEDLLKHPLDEVAGFILTGSHHRISKYGVDNLPTLYLNMAALTSGKPVLGICFGFQFMTWVEGAPIRRRCARRCGKFPTLLSSGDAVPLHYHCCDQPVYIPKDFVIDGWDAVSGEAQIIRHQSKPWMGVQFHPEVSGPFGLNLLSLFIQFCLFHNPR